MSTNMFLEKIRSEGIAHLSYVIGHNSDAAVIDPRRDCAIYMDIAARHGASITHIFETHRNEDYVIGSTELADQTGAEIYHGEGLDFAYGHSVKEGEQFDLGDLRLTVLKTPGHTYESISLVVEDTGSAEEPVAVFTGDALFIGDVGRTDFFPDNAEEVAGLLYESIFEKLLPLGDQVILLPAHGAGSVCGSSMAAREFSTIGYERRHNPRLQVTDREEFVRRKMNEKHDMPPYFKQMEKYNQEGSAPFLGAFPPPRPMRVEVFESALNDGMLALDVRSPEAFAGAFIPDSLAIPLDMVPAFAGWFLSYDQDIGIVAESPGQAQTARRHLVRIGYDRILGYLENGLTSWEMAGHSYSRIPAIHASELVRRIRQNEPFTLLDVRKEEEVESGKLQGAVHIYLGELPDRLGEIPGDRPITTFCGSGQRAIIAASILKRNGFDQVEDSLGSMMACSAIGCPIEK
jgi:hydroxyacylglutathione hydrolase